MSKHKKFFLIIICILLNSFLIIGFLVVRDATMANTLKEEAKTISKLDITKNRYNLKVRTRGNYGIVEKSVKTYLDDYAISLQKMLSIMGDSKLTQLFSYNNYVKDGPEFKESLTYLQAAKEEFNSQIDQLLVNSEEDVIRAYGKEKISNTHYYDLYVDMILSDSMKKQFSDAKVFLSQIKVEANEVFEVSGELLNFLIVNKDFWKLEEGEIRFQTEALYNQYNMYVSKLSQ